MLTLLTLLVASVGGLSVSTSRPLESSLLQKINIGAPDAQIAELVRELEAANENAEPALSPLIEGAWRLVHTSKSDFDPRNPLGRRADGSSPGLEGFFAKITGGDGDAANRPSSSPIQRAVTSAFTVSQSIRSLGGGGRVEQIVTTPAGELNLNAAARVDRAAPRRVSFAFDEGYFEFKQAGLPRLPYPVPFRLLGKEAEGWLDTSYLSEAMRISTGNKGTVFVLVRATDEPVS